MIGKLVPQSTPSAAGTSSIDSKMSTDKKHNEGKRALNSVGSSHLLNEKQEAGMKFNSQILIQSKSGSKTEKKHEISPEKQNKSTTLFGKAADKKAKFDDGPEN